MNIYDTVTQSIIESLESVDSKDFKLPWHSSGVGIFPKNVATNKPYRGVNILSLFIAQEKRGYSNGLWGTFKQWKDLGAKVKRGEKSVTIVLWKSSEKDLEKTKNGEEKELRIFAAAYHVFNVAQVEGYSVTLPTPENKNERIEHAESFFSTLGADVRSGGDSAFYSIANDYIQMPPLNAFHDSVYYYSTLAHEITHWAGAEKRLARDQKGRFGSETYAKEELIAELGATFLSAELGLENKPRRDHAAYLSTWLKVLKDDNRAIFSAASKAQAAVDYLKSFQSKSLKEAA
jgi:antirestriction protein ArdC